jgi:hypothetical protein
MVLHSGAEFICRERHRTFRNLAYLIALLLLHFHLSRWNLNFVLLTVNPYTPARSWDCVGVQWFVFLPSRGQTLVAEPETLVLTSMAA